MQNLTRIEILFLQLDLRKRQNLNISGMLLISVDLSS